MLEYLTVAKELIPSLTITLTLFFYTILMAVPLGLLLSIGSTSGIKALRTVVGTYNWILRGTPLMLQIIFVYYVVPMIISSFFGAGFNINRMTAAILAFVLNYAAYFAEIFRAGIESVGKGQHEAANALGFSKTKTMRFVVLPQMLKMVLPPVANETITLVKDTSLVSVIAISDLLYKAKTMVIVKADLFPFGVVAIFYLVMTYVITKGFDYLERLNNHSI